MLGAQAAHRGRGGFQRLAPPTRSPLRLIAVWISWLPPEALSMLGLQA